jgi:hypothetical protein
VYLTNLKTTSFPASTRFSGKSALLSASTLNHQQRKYRIVEFFFGEILAKPSLLAVPGSLPELTTRLHNPSYSGGEQARPIRPRASEDVDNVNVDAAIIFEPSKYGPGE